MVTSLLAKRRRDASARLRFAVLPQGKKFPISEMKTRRFCAASFRGFAARQKISA
jgi:hypothetical protein